MSSEREVSPARLLRRVMRACLPRTDREDLLIEMDRLYRREAGRRGAVRAAWWYACQIPSFVIHLLFDRIRRLRPASLRAGGRGSGPRARAGVRADALLHGLRDASRSVRRSPAWALTSVLAMSIGVAGISVVFGVANWVMLRPVPGVAAPGELVTVLLGSTETDRGSWPISHPDLQVLRSRATVATGIAGSTGQDVHFSAGPGQAAESIEAEIVTSNFFDVLGVRMTAGRAFASGEDEAGSGGSVVISDRLWRRHWNGDPRAIGSAVWVNGDAYVVVGVTSSGFHGESLPGRAEMWFAPGALPSLLHTADILERGSAQVWGSMIVRLAPGASLAHVLAEMNRGLDAIRIEKAGEAHSFMANHVVFRAFEGIGLDPLLRDSVGSTLMLLGATAVFLLLLACANVTNLGLLRSASLRATLAVRRSLGAGTGRLLADRIIETSMIGLLGAGVGVVLAVVTMALLRRSGFGLVGVPLDGVTLDARVVAFTAVAGMVAGVVSGLGPALASRTSCASDVLRANRHGDRRTTRVRSALVIAQVAISAVLLVGAGLFARTLLNLRHVDLGIAQANVVTFSLKPDLQGYDEASRTRLIESLLRRLGERPGILSAGLVFAAPFDALSIPVVIKTHDAEWNAADVYARSFQIAGDFFGTYGLELIAGRSFRIEEWLQKNTMADPVAILNESAARQLFPSEDPAAIVGRTIDSRSTRGRAVRIVGVVRDARLVRPALPPAPAYFLPWSQGFDVGQFTVALRVSGPARTLFPDIRSIVGDIDPGLPVLSPRTVPQRLSELLAEERLNGALALTLALLGVILSALGLYGVLACDVAQRTREIGIRSALGAVPQRILSLVAWGGLGLAGTGAIAGLAASLLLTRFLESRLFGIGRLDAGTYVAGIVVLGLVALLATWVPARRALRVDPMVALRED